MIDRGVSEPSRGGINEFSEHSVSDEHVKFVCTKFQGVLRECIWDAGCALVRVSGLVHNVPNKIDDVLYSGTSMRGSETPCLIHGPNSIISTAVRFQCGPIGKPRCVDLSR